MKFLSFSCIFSVALSYSFTFANQELMSRKVYNSIIQPVFDAKCVECHGPNKSKGKLKLHTKKDFLTGGSGAGSDILIQGNVDESELIFRITLPSDDDEAMPPMDDKDHYNPVTSEELNVMKNWVKLGASFDMLVSELDTHSQSAALHVFKNMPKKIISKTVALQPKLPVVPKADPAALEKIRNAGILAMPISQNTNAIYVNASYLGKKFTDDKLNLLIPISNQLLWLNLARTGITDKGTPLIAKNKLLTRLHLENTSISDSSTNHLSNLSDLEYLNLYGTKISDASISNLKKLKKLKKIFLWQTKMTTDGAIALKKHYVNAEEYESLMEKKKSKKAIITNYLNSQQNKIKSLEESVSVVSKTTNDKKPINNNCPVSQKRIDPSISSTFEGRIVGLCCKSCKSKFDKDGSSYRTKIQNFESSDQYLDIVKKLQTTQSKLDKYIQESQEEIRKISTQISNMGPEVNIGWKNPVASN